MQHLHYYSKWPSKNSSNKKEMKIRQSLKIPAKLQEQILLFLQKKIGSPNLKLGKSQALK